MVYQKKGLRTRVVQGGQLVVFVKRALAETEKDYTQIGKEPLAALSEIKKYQQFTSGHAIVAFTDHKPLENGWE